MHNGRESYEGCENTGEGVKPSFNDDKVSGCGWTAVTLQVCDYKSKLTTVVIFPLT